MLCLNICHQSLASILLNNLSGWRLAMKEICEYCFSELAVEDEKVEGNRKFIWKRCTNDECGETFLFVEYLWQLNLAECSSFQVVAG